MVKSDMNWYKKLIRSRSLRMKILSFFSWIPDKAMVRLQYRIKLGRKINFTSPQRYTEKLQVYKLNYRNSLMVTCVDKFDVRDYLSEEGFGDILTKCYGVYNDPSEINFEKLPKAFVLKDTLGCGGNSIIICKDKATFEFDKAKTQMKQWVSTPLKKSGGREWPYYFGKKHRILIEEYIDSSDL